MKNVEIERKWLLDGFPDLPVLERCVMEQGYLNFHCPTVRTRKSTSESQQSHRLTIKGEGTLVRTEVELPLDEEQYVSLQSLLAAKAVKKERRTYRLPGGEILECSLVDEGEACSFFYAEVEFPDVAAAQAFTPPAFLGREVTQEPEQSMANYCRRKAEKP